MCIFKTVLQQQTYTEIVLFTQVENKSQMLL